MMKWLGGWLAICASTMTMAAPSAIEQEVAYRTNLERKAVGLSPLKLAAELDVAAGGHSAAMSADDFFAHCNLVNGKTPWTRMMDAGYAFSAAAENIAAGHSSAESVMNSWMNSSGHRANILGSSFRELGVGYVYDAGDGAPIMTDQNGDCVADSNIGSPMRRYWTQKFGARYGVYPLVLDLEARSTPDCTVAVYLHGSGWADDYRIRQAGRTWSGWRSFRAESTLGVVASAGSTVTVEAELRRGSSVVSSSDGIRLGLSCQAAGGGSVDVVLRNGFEG